MEDAAEVSARGLGRRGHFAFAEVGRPDVDRTHVGADQVGLAGDAGGEGGGGDAVTELTGGAE